MAADDGMKIKVGALVLVSTALLVGFVALLGTFSVGERVSIRVELADAGGLLAGAPVRIAGVRAGRVEVVEFLVDSRTRETAPKAGELPVHVRVVASIDADKFPAIRQDSEFFVTSQGVLGEKYLEIRPGRPETPALEAGAAVRAEDPARIDLIFARAESILTQIEAALSGGGELGVGELVSSLTGLSTRVNGYLERHQSRLDQATEDIVATTADLRAVIGAVRTGIGTGEELTATLRDTATVIAVMAREAGPVSVVAREALGNLGRAAAAIIRLVELSEPMLDMMSAELPGVLAEVPGMLASGKGALNDLAAISARVADGQGLVGKVLIDDEIYADLKAMLRDIKDNPWKLLWRE